MTRYVDNEILERFLSDLFRADDTVAVRAYSAYFIKEFRDELEAFIDKKVAASGANYEMVKWAESARKRLLKYEQGPAGYIYNPDKGCLELLYTEPTKSFRLFPAIDESLTLANGQRFTRLAGYIISCIIAGVVLWMGLVIKQALEEFGHQWIRAFDPFL